MGYELCSYLAQSKVKSCENSLNIGLNPFRNGFGTPEREERVKYFSTSSNVHVECSRRMFTRLCSRKRKGGTMK